MNPVLVMNSWLPRGARNDHTKEHLFELSLKAESVFLAGRVRNNISASENHIKEHIIL